VWGVRRSGRLIEMQTSFDSEYISRGFGGRRGCVSEFSWASRRRLLKRIAAINWQVLGDRWFVTLTYQGAGFPTDMRDAKAHLKAWRKRYEARYGKIDVAVWKMEFQARGAVHFHLMIRQPQGLFLDGSGRRDSIDQFRSWCSTNWYEVVGSNDKRHKSAGTNVQLSVSDGARYFAYMLKEKEDQNTVPEGVTNCGRFWGVWGYKVEFDGALLTQEEYETLNRVLCEWERLEGRGPGSPKSRLKEPRRDDSYVSNWFLTDPGDATRLYQLLKCLDRDLVPVLAKARSSPLGGRQHTGQRRARPRAWAAEWKEHVPRRECAISSAEATVEGGRLWSQFGGLHRVCAGAVVNLHQPAG
jgi:hypothetical protein